mmetsp:Transcript_22754/g.63527  ORF Transcript_22754/g.63527 Transcript_22754/m.63527 type:complete len:166 (+) Transcript_22754:693-1190(+)
MTAPTDQDFEHRLAMASRGVEEQKYYIAVMYRMAFRFFVFFVCETALQLNLQSSDWAMAIAESDGDGFDVQQFFSIILSLMSGINFIAMESRKMHRAYQKFGGITALVIFACFSAIAVALVFYAAVKLYMGAAMCPDGAWNLKGCVVLDKSGIGGAITSRHLSSE